MDILIPQTETETLNRVLNRFETVRRYRLNFEPIWLQSYRNYINFRKKEAEGKANVFIPLTYYIVETLTAHILSLYSVRPLVLIHPREPQDEINARILTELINYQLQRIEFNSIIENIVKSASLYGTGVAKIFWEKREVVKSINPILPPVVLEDYDAPVIEPIDIFDFYIDWYATDLQNASYIIHRTYEDLEKLQAMQEAGIYMNVEKLKEGERMVRTDDFKTEKYALRQTQEQTTYTDKYTTKIELLEYWEKNRVITVANRRVVLRDIDNPFIHNKFPFAMVRFNSIPNEFYGRGDAEIISKIQEIINDLTNQRLDNVNLMINKMFKVNRGAGIVPEQLKSRPGGIIWANDINAIQEIQFTDTTGGVFADVFLMFKQLIDEVTGVTDLMRGTLRRRETATAIAVMQKMSGARLALRIQEINDFIREIANQLWQLSLQFLTKPQIISIVGVEGTKFQEVSVTNITGRFDFSVSVATEPLGTIEERIQKLITAIQSLQGSGLNILPLVEQLLRDMKIERLDEVLKKVEPPETKST